MMKEIHRFGRRAGRTLRTRTAVMTSLIAGFGSLALADSPLDPYLWHNRILLVRREVVGGHVRVGENRAFNPLEQL